MTKQLTSGAGIGLRTTHFSDFMALRPDVPFVEVHAENHLGGGAMRQVLHDVRRDHDISLHCVGLSIGSRRFDRSHATRIRRLANEIQPALVSDHLSLSTLEGQYSNDLLPLPYTEEALAVACAHVRQAQDILGQQILIENPSRYLSWSHSTISEHDFLEALATRTGCALLCDVNNIYVTARNEGLDPLACLQAFPAKHIREVHLAGHDIVELEGHMMRIDTHDRPVCDDVWDLFTAAQNIFGAQPTLIEWDSELPSLDVLLAEAGRASSIMTNSKERLIHAAAC
jgi:uncharacterized protein (UPF0276 family)